MNKNILNQAFITMGYRKLDDNTYGKPIGYGLLYARIDAEEDKVVFKTLFQNMKNEMMVWGSYDMNLDVNDPDWVNTENMVESENDITEDNLYEYYINKIACSEWLSHTEKIVQPVGSHKVFAFRTNNDIINIL